MKKIDTRTNKTQLKVQLTEWHN